MGGTGDGGRAALGRGRGVVRGGALRGRSPRAEDQEDCECSEPSQRDLLSPLAETTADFPGDGL